MMYLALLSVAAAAKCPLESVKCKSTVFAKDFSRLEKQVKDLGDELDFSSKSDLEFRPRDQIVYDLECRDGPYAVATSNGLYVRFMAHRWSDWQVATLPVSDFKKISCDTELKERTWEQNEAAIKRRSKKHKRWLPARLALFPKEISDVIFRWSGKDLFTQSLIRKFCLDDKLSTDDDEAAQKVYMTISLSTIWLEPLQRQQLTVGRLRRVECPTGTKWVWARLVKNKPQQVLLIDTDYKKFQDTRKVSLTRRSSLKKVC